MTAVYLLYHIREMGPDKEDQKLIGIYSTEEKAKNTITRLRDKPGFKDYPDGFKIFDDVLDRDGWTEGFVDLK